METSAGEIPFGKACFRIVLNSEKPSALAALIYSSCRMRKNSARVNLAIPVHEVKPISTIKLMNDGFAIAATERIKINVGSEIKTSIMREIIESTGTLIFFFRKEILAAKLPVFENKKITTSEFLKKYLNSPSIKLLSKLNNKVVLQNDEDVKLFTLKDSEESTRFLNSLGNHFRQNNRIDVIVVSESSNWRCFVLRTKCFIEDISFTS